MFSENAIEWPRGESWIVIDGIAAKVAREFDPIRARQTEGYIFSIVSGDPDRIAGALAHLVSIGFLEVVNGEFPETERSYTLTARGREAVPAQELTFANHNHHVAKVEEHTYVLSPRDYAVLRVLWLKSGKTVREIEGTIGKGDPPDVIDSIDRIVTMGLCLRGITLPGEQHRYHITNTGVRVGRVLADRRAPEIEEGYFVTHEGQEYKIVGVMARVLRTIQRRGIVTDWLIAQELQAPEADVQKSIESLKQLGLVARDEKLQGFHYRLTQKGVVLFQGKAKPDYNDVNTVRPFPAYLLPQPAPGALSFGTLNEDAPTAAPVDIEFVGFDEIPLPEGNPPPAAGAHGRKWEVMLYDDGTAAVSEYTIGESGEQAYVGRGFREADQVAGMVGAIRDPSGRLWKAMAELERVQEAIDHDAEYRHSGHAVIDMETATAVLLSMYRIQRGRATASGCRTT